MRRFLEKLTLASALLPLAMSAINLRLLRAPPLPRTNTTCRVSLLIPARNEAANITGALGAALATRDIPFEIVVLDDHSTDGTGAIARAIADPRLRVIDSAPLPTGWTGKNHASAQLAAAARYELLLFLDADVRIQPDGVARLAERVRREPSLAMLSGVPRQITVGALEWLLLPLINVLLLGYLPLILDRKTVPGFATACGQLVMVRADAYQAIGGHGAIRSRLHDGIALARAFRRNGFRTALTDATPVASCRMYRRNRDVWSGLTKNATEGMATPRGLPVWTILLGAGHVLPFLLPASRPVTLARLASILFRSLIALRFRQGFATVLASPLGVGLLLIVQWQSFIGKLLGRPVEWRGRAYSEGPSP
ncbi:glycosyltransferase [Neoasaia chiangmaiensis NBRC 101099]|uniref:Glycosyl transferase n=1 Tax=Neoasaia chiangmaiensis TaxID=320497 RepID=A0A1U9KS49_9PROT|nr:glycosyltransferase family 2 protein [Neoasaia chiangmaiensis]AQS88628.1 glycosyl transferase [Neoasaia chiangmaiensis]GBR36033.1 glycosyltransferase [Neoasaia chiangmaiensis NBRC 101099]GEN15493.1 glycosyl transferase [Neoasaia chiangmaiensis]